MTAERDALAELVAAQDADEMKDPEAWVTRWNAAWAAARAALAAQPAETERERVQRICGDIRECVTTIAAPAQNNAPTPGMMEGIRQIAADITAQRKAPAPGEPQLDADARKAVAFLRNRAEDWRNSGNAHKTAADFCADLIGRQAREIAAANAECVKLRGWINDAEQAAGREQRRAERVEAECEKLRADAERIDWLAANPRKATIRIGGDMKPCVFYGVSCDQKWSAREAIDAAREGEMSDHPKSWPKRTAAPAQGAMPTQEWVTRATSQTTPGDDVPVGAAPAPGEPQDYDDLVARLLTEVDMGEFVATGEEYISLTAREAATAIATLRAENERQAREIAELREERKDWARRFMLDGRTPWEWENACKRAETSESAWEILCGGKQKIIDALETERAVWKDKAETRGRAGCEARAKLAQAERIIAAADAMRDWASVEHFVQGRHVGQMAEDKCALCKSTVAYDRERAGWKP